MRSIGPRVRGYLDLDLDHDVSMSSEELSGDEMRGSSSAGPGGGGGRRRSPTGGAGGGEGIYLFI